VHRCAVDARAVRGIKEEFNWVLASPIPFIYKTQISRNLVFPQLSLYYRRTIFTPSTTQPHCAYPNQLSIRDNHLFIRGSSPSSRIPRCPDGLYRGSVARVWLGPNCFRALGSSPGLLQGPILCIGGHSRVCVLLLQPEYLNYVFSLSVCREVRFIQTKSKLLS
jgi:hypothetical protein